MPAGKMTADLLGGPTIEIGDRDGESVTTLTLDEALELFHALGDALIASRRVDAVTTVTGTAQNIATGNAVVGQQIGSIVGGRYKYPDDVIDVDPYDEVPCSCPGLGHRIGCPNWIMPI